MNYLCNNRNCACFDKIQSNEEENCKGCSKTLAPEWIREYRIQSETEKPGKYILAEASPFAVFRDWLERCYSQIALSEFDKAMQEARKKVEKRKLLWNNIPSDKAEDYARRLNRQSEDDWFLDEILG